jgi:hypothetical protein
MTIREKWQLWRGKDPRRTGTRTRRQLRLEPLEARLLLTAIIKGPYLQQFTETSMVVYVGNGRRGVEPRRL